MQKIGTIKAIWIYPIKSMKGISVEAADMYWYGLLGDRRYAYVQSENRSSFPWLTGREIPQIVQYQPRFTNDSDRRFSDIQVTTPAGQSHTATSPELHQQLATQLKQPIHLMQLNRGAFDAAPMSIVSLATAKRLEDVHGSDLDYRRFRINVIVDSEDQTPYCEDNWIDGSLKFGEREDSAAILPVRPIQRCVMVNIDPDTAEKDAAVLKNVNKSRDNCVGVYAWPRQVGTLKVGDSIFYRPE
ncbi:MAG: MOSC domain-containing protein [Anaerolineae bacterium]